MCYEEPCFETSLWLDNGHGMFNDTDYEIQVKRLLHFSLIFIQCISMTSVAIRSPVVSGMRGIGLTPVVWHWPYRACIALHMI